MVPFTMPLTRWIRSPVSDSRRARTKGYGPGDRCLVEKVDLLLTSQGPKRNAVGRCQQLLVGGDHRLPRFESQCESRLPAGSRPPISSTTMSIDGSATNAAGSSVSNVVGIVAGRDRTGRRRRCRRVPAGPTLDSDGSARVCSNSTRAVPTLPQPSTATRSVAGADLACADLACADVAFGDVAFGDEVIWSRYRLGRRPQCRNGGDRRTSRAARRAGTPRRPRTPRPGAGPCCNWRPSSDHRRR